MASQEEQLRLVAEVVDKFSPQLKQMLKSFQQISAAGKEVHEKGAKETTAHAKAYKELGERVDRWAVGDGTAGRRVGRAVAGALEVLCRCIDRATLVGADRAEAHDLSLAGLGEQQGLPLDGCGCRAADRNVGKTRDRGPLRQRRPRCGLSRGTCPAGAACRERHGSGAEHRCPAQRDDGATGERGRRVHGDP